MTHASSEPAAECGSLIPLPIVRLNRIAIVLSVVLAFVLHQASLIYQVAVRLSGLRGGRGGYPRVTVPAHNPRNTRRRPKGFDFNGTESSTPPIF
jgi:hypothetical protein